MNTKDILAALIVLFTTETIFARNQESPDSLTRELQEVIVTSKQSVTKLVGSTLTSTITGTTLANLGTALDVLAQLPMIKVEGNNISVIGKNNIEIYIDGRPLRDEFELQQILSSNLKKVELLMAPGATYDSTTGAVIKITTRRNFIKGLSVTDQFELKRNRRWSVMDYLNMNYRTGKWDFFLNGVINRNNLISKGATTNSLIYNDKPTIVGSSQNNHYPTTTGAIKAGINYAGDDQSFGAYYRYNPERGDFLNKGTEWLDNNQVINRNIAQCINAHSHYLSLYFDKRIKEEFLIHFDGDFKKSLQKKSVTTSYPASDHSSVSSADEKKSTFGAGKLYLTLPLLQGDFTVGSQAVHTYTSLDYRMLNEQVGQYIPSSFTEARQTSAALFSTWAKNFGKTYLSAGLRYEYVDYDFRTNGKRDGNMSRRNHLITPDITLGYSFDDETQLSVSYKQATVRPPYSQLTGSLSYSGLHEIEGGNPSLRNEKMHDIQLFGSRNGFIFQADYIRSFDTYAFVKQLYPADNLQLIMHPVNINVSALSAYLVWSKSIRNWTPNITFGVYRQWLHIETTKYNRPFFSYYFDNTFSLPGGWIFTANINGHTQGNVHTNCFANSLFTMDASIGKIFLKRALNVKLSVTDIFNTLDSSWTMNTYGIAVNKNQNFDFRGITLNVIYNFQPRKSNYKGVSAAEEELQRL